MTQGVSDCTDRNGQEHGGLSGKQILGCCEVGGNVSRGIGGVDRMTGRGQHPRQGAAEPAESDDEDGCVQEGSPWVEGSVSIPP